MKGERGAALIWLLLAALLFFLLGGALLQTAFLTCVSAVIF